MPEKKVSAANQTERSDFTEPQEDCLVPADAADSDFARHIQRIADESAVRDLAARFSDACNTRNVSAFRRLWTLDAVWEIGEPLPARAEGVNKIARFRDAQIPHSAVAY